ncbi:MAG TPA: HEAT repeat domain-containing protein [Longimicrobiaceae bacterium]|nr:HEAT repeat domain-containing protein [Longimicrobiaceae bacterium]
MSEKSVPAMVVDLAKGYALSEFFPLTHPTFVEVLLKLEAALLATGEELVLSVSPGGISVRGEVVARRSPHVQRLCARLHEHEVRELALRHDAGSETVGRLLSALALPPRVAKAAGGLGVALAAAGAQRIAVNGERIQPSAAHGSHGVSPDSVWRPGEGGMALWSAHDMYEQVQLSARRVETEDPAELRRMLHQGTDSERIEALQRLEFVAQWFLTRGMLDRAVAVVDDLRRDAEALAGKNPGTRGHVMLAMHRIADRAMIEEMVGRLGKVRTEEERAGLRSTLLHLGAEVVTPLVRSLVAATDLSARRSYRDALVELDRVGVPLLEDMIGDERWFVVRNMVGILGEVKSADALDHFSRTVKHHDARVRRETILALSKFGGAESVPLLGQALNDPDAGLRTAAALGLGLTKAGTAVIPLMRRLAQETDQEAVTEILRALGRCGDPRAVPALAERAGAGGFFSRTPVPIRVEAVRALAEIGGDAAKAVLQRLLRDRVPEVRDAALKSVGG